MDKENIFPLLHVYIKLLNFPDKKPKIYELTINIKELKTFDGSFGLLSLISNELQIQITTKIYEIQMLYMNSWINIIDLKTFFYFCSCNIIEDQETYLQIKKKENISGDYEEEEVSEMIEANKISMKPISQNSIVKCSVCAQFSDNEYYTRRLGPIYGPFKYSNCKYYVHFLCVLWLPLVSISKSNKLVNAGKEINRAKKERCCYCHIGGAGLACWMTCQDKCSKSYHYLCAKSDGCYFNKNSYGILCPKHKKKYTIPDRDELKNGNVLFYKKEGNIDEDEIMVCDICKMSCDQDKILICGDCKKKYHEQCVGYNSGNNGKSSNKRLIISDDIDEKEENEEIIEDNDQEYICFTCKKEKENKK